MNEQKRPQYVTAAITQAAVAALLAGTFKHLSISALCGQAQVSRNSFYRNFSSKADILRQYVRTLLRSLPTADDQGQPLTGSAQYAQLFDLIEARRQFFLALQAQGYLDLLRDCMVSDLAQRPPATNQEAYAIAFVMYGTYGWIRAWLDRGMPESGATLAAALRAGGFA